MEIQPREIRHYVTYDGKDLFQIWTDNLRDTTGRRIIRKRIGRVLNGNFGDHGSIGEGVWELRIHYGPGYRIYYAEDGPVIVILLCGGEKDTQAGDIRKAKEIWADYRRRI